MRELQTLPLSPHLADEPTRDTGLAMYDKFYRLSGLAFQLIPDAQFFFESSIHRQAMAYLSYGLRHAGGFIVITGEIGAGKTILVDHLLSTVDHNKFFIAKIVTTRLSGDDFLYLVASGFGIAPEGLTKGPLLQKIMDLVIAQQRIGRRPVLIVDEAQNLTLDALEELRMLSNVVLNKEFALQSLLLGQPQFRAVLENPSLEQLRQRVTAAYHLGPLNEVETRAYVEHRLRQADWKGDPNLSDDCFWAIYRHSGGLPRRINSLCSRLLLHGFLEELHTLTGNTALRVAGYLRDENRIIAGYSNDAHGAEVTSRVDNAGVKPETLINRILLRFRSGANEGQSARKFWRIGWWMAPTFGGLAIFLLVFAGSGSTRPPALITLPTLPTAYGPPPAPARSLPGWPEEASSAPKAASSSLRSAGPKPPHNGNHKKTDKQK
jgi:general secretion pathway protein A